MNNEFEKNPETVENTDDNTSIVKESNNNEIPELAAEKIPVVDTVEEETYIPEAESVKAFGEDCFEEQAEESPKTEYMENANGSESYTYSTDAAEKQEVVGCVWDSNPDDKKVKKPKSSAAGFKVFVAVMLSVFTVSVVTIAAFLVADHLQNATDSSDKAGSTQGSTYSDYSPITVYPNAGTTMISTFTEEEGGLTKSQVAAKCSPSAVGIVIEKKETYSGYSYNIPYFGFGDFGGFDFGYPGGTQIVQGSGSGFVYSADGYIITNHHVIDGADKITVYFNDGSTMEATLIGSDSLSDIAVIKVDAAEKVLVPIEIGDSNLMKVGDEVLAIGCPAGIEFMGTVTDGIISAINRDVELDNDGTSKTKTMTLLQTNATINRGNSGGPLINTRGQVIGINTLKLSSDYEGIGFSIPMNGALPIIKQLIEHGEVIERSESFVSSEGVIGISASEITEQESKYYDIPVGVLVVQIDKDSSASKAGLRRGDIITKFNGEAVTTVNELNRLKSAFKAGETVTITVFRDSDGTDETFDLSFKLDMAE